MIGRIEIDDRVLASPLGRASPVLKLAVALGWLVGLAVSLDPRPPLVVAAVALTSGRILGALPTSRLAGALAPLWLAAIGIATFNTLFAGANADPTQLELTRLGPLRITEAALAAGIGLGLRVVAIASVGAVFGLTTDATRLVDALVQQARVPERFAYAALAAYQAIPRFSQDLATLRQARRIRGLRGEWHPRILVGLLVLAIRYGDRLALAMDARAFGSGPRTTYREVRWGRTDGLLGLGAVAVLAVALLTATF